MERVLAQVRPGSIIISHDGGGPRAQTLAAYPLIIRALRARGYRFLTVPELLGFTPSTAAACASAKTRRSRESRRPGRSSDPALHRRDRLRDDLGVVEREGREPIDLEPARRGRIVTALDRELGVQLVQIGD